ncbi:CHAT domain-containing protein [Amycolatopsis xylanica]|uniref:CHAT domain-containing protein n=1 Tax=Amycolatopsis xylanica TaxID=589385 RepID=A0A1H3G3P9_9PSEU|nr:CHAT domain-containing protein [Amycolatopsis xylanica]SDX97009.1 CHAT domain-containing protein [Amycolatopsis xylanica]
MDRPTARQQALAALRRADVDAGRAAPVAERAAVRALREGDKEAVSMAERAWGRAVLQKDVAGAIRHLRRSIDFAGGCPVLAGEARILLAAALLQRGRPDAALREIELAVETLDARGVARARAQRADLLHQIGRLDQAQAEYQVAVPLLRRSGDQISLQRTLVNRGILFTERYAFAAAEADLTEADALARRLGRQLAVGIIAENLGFLETVRGDVPAALAHLSRAEHLIGELGGQLGPVFSDQAELLLSVGARAEAGEAAGRAVEAFENERRRLLIPPARLLVAQAAQLGQDWATALDQATRARREFTRQRRSEWAELAQLAILRARLASGLGTRMAGGRVETMVETLTAAGWPASALEARLAAARLAFDRGDRARGRAYLVAASASTRRGPAALRARGWYARALLAWEDGDARATTRAVRAGLRILDEHAAALGATDLRAHSAAHRIELSELGLRFALRSGKPAAVFEWAERGRASRLAHRPVRPPDDPELAALLAELRATAEQIYRYGQAGLRTRQAALERRIRDHVRLRPGAPVEGVEPVKTPALGDRALVEFVQLDGVLHAVTLVDGRIRLATLGQAAPVADLVDRLPFALHRLASRGGSAASRAAAMTLLDSAAAALDRALFTALPEVGDRPLVLVPTGPLHSVPWSVLPSCHGRPVTVSPSATLWHAVVARRGGPFGTVAVAAGPGLTGAHHEAHAVAALHGTTPLAGAAATVDAVLKAVASADVLHLAAHGRLAVDQPLFSDLRLHDGPLVVHDLERLDRVPRLVVLASCDSGRSVVCTGDELLGLSATFMARGTVQLVAPVVPVPDAETAPLMIEFHRGLAEGLRPAVALADAQKALRGNGHAGLVAAAGFVCFGAGH